MDIALFDAIRSKSLLKKDIYQQSLHTFQIFRKVLRSLNDTYNAQYQKQERVEFRLNESDDERIELTFGSDVLIFMLHSNIFQFPRLHEVMKTQYVSEDTARSYCGMINIYNFLSDSFKYRRYNDLGYMIGRVFINKDLHFFIEGKKELGRLYFNFSTSEIDETAVKDIITSAIQYTVNFDLLTPPFDEVKLVRLEDIQAASDVKLVTGKRLGFRFQGDHIEVKEPEI